MTKLVNIDSLLIKDRKARVEIAKKSHLWFFHTYFPHYVKDKTAPFQKEIIGITEDDGMKMAVIVAFRGSAKSTIISLSYPLWAVLSGKRKFVLILSQNYEQAKQILRNIRIELESNEMLISDFGSFTSKKGNLGTSSILFPKLGAKIMAASSEQSIRGIRHREFRPDLIICDDIEDLNSVRNHEGRDKTYNWINGEVIPLGDSNTKTIIVGNLLHEDSTLMRLKKDIEEGGMNGIYREYPLIDSCGKCLWPGKFPDLKAIELARSRVGSEQAWSREFLLTILPDSDRIIQRSWIKTYGSLPDPRLGYRFTAVGVDLAISQKETADYTAIVTAHVYGYGDDLRIYIEPCPVNERLTALQTQQKIISIADRLLQLKFIPQVFVEKVGYQGALIEMLKSKGLKTEGAEIHGQDKRARLSMISGLVEAGKVFFPEKGAEILIGQLVNFGIEKHDDLADAFSIVLTEIQKKAKRPTAGVLIAG